MAGIGTGGKRLVVRISKLILVHKNFPPATQAILCLTQTIVLYSFELSEFPVSSVRAAIGI